MSGALIAAIFWALTATVTALLPMRRQMVPGLALMIAAPLLIIWIGYVHGWLACILALLAFVSMFRNPLLYVFRRMTGRAAPVPPELERRK
ncbi:DUF2484 family protein [Neotabrizicola sp. sgz301269]|uniref:DUF2484 family protein n=1 Tax=Neotabrizicola sp. sgz301269 TaxID=3276282 RepID=UPI00377048C9